MKKFEVVWEESRRFKCSTEIAAETEEEAIQKAQEYENDVDEREIYCEDQYRARVKIIE